MPVTEQQARAIAFLAVSARPHGATRWDEAGVYANVLKVADRSLGSVVIATMQAAEDRKAQSPGVIPASGPHWRNPESAPSSQRTPYDPMTFCGTCGKPEHGATDHPFVSVGHTRAATTEPRIDALRAARAEATSGFCRHGAATCKDCDRAHAASEETEPTEPTEAAS
ncbi:MAG: hypothetical protein H0X12_13520 [Nocardioides sp.]|nr:hypothetical protein [Nocardioides sp.]